ncbi:hypothetical protein Btru_010052 [Bulinus truncatus]|nr:hypothetical protein Btru_010052 [Bulinus truncatus]
MSNLASHAFISLLVLLLISGTDVHSLHTKDLTNSSNKDEARQHQSYGLKEDSNFADTNLPDFRVLDNVNRNSTEEKADSDINYLKVFNKNFDSDSRFNANQKDSISKESGYKNSMHQAQESFHSDTNVYDEHSRSDNASSHIQAISTDFHEHSQDDGASDVAFNFDEGENDSLTFNHTKGNLSIANYSDDSYLELKPENPSSRCLSCQIRNDSRNLRIQTLKNQILRHLNIKNLPNVSREAIPKIPALSHLYDIDKDMMNDAPRNNNEDGDDFIVKTERVFTAAREAGAGNNFNLSDSVYFSQPVQLSSSYVRAAKLWLYIRKAQLNKPYVLLTVNRVFRENGNNVFTKQIYSTKIDHTKASGWKRIELRDIVEDWVKHPMGDVGLQLRAEDDKGNNLIVLPPSSDVDKGYEPWIDIRIQDSRSNSRHKRSESLVCSENATETRCCRYPLYVSFAEFGWSWIIAPTHVQADYCSGECRMTMQDNTPYSWVNQQVPRSGGGSGGSCCSPTKMLALPLLYFDEQGNILYQILQNMKVKQCGCMHAIYREEMFIVFLTLYSSGALFICIRSKFFISSPLYIEWLQKNQADNCLVFRLLLLFFLYVNCPRKINKFCCFIDKIVLFIFLECL